MTSSQLPSTSGPQSPRKLGRYEIIELLGKGAMGLVFLARDPIIGRQLALKTFHVGFSAQDAELEQFRQRFVREAQSAGILSHPNIVTIHDVLVEGVDEFFIAMEYVEGTDLKLLMQKQGRFEVRHAVDIAAQVADGLDYAHSKSVVHRDIKPANVILTPEGQAKITDFGIARMDTSNLTVEGQLLGTPNYMAPEQIQAKEVDHRADLFSLGVVLYEMVTGRKPFKGENLTQVSHKIAYEAHPDPRDYRPEVPPRLVEVLDKALSKKPADRYQSGNEMAGDLRTVYSPAGDTGELASQSFLDSLAPPPGAAPGGANHSTPPPPPLSGEIDLVSGRVMLPGDAAREAAAAAPARTGGGRALWIAGGVVLLLVLVAIGFLAGQGGGESAIPPPLDPQIEARRQAEPLVERGREALTAGDPSLALDFFDQALALAPGDKGIRSLRDDASRRILQSDTALEDKAIEERIGRIETAIALKEWDRAVSEAEELLAIEPANQKAKRLLDEATTRRRAARNARDRLQGRRPSQSAPPPPAAVPPAPAAAAKGTLDIEFQSDISKGVLTVFQAGQSLFKQDFEFQEEKGKGIFKRTRPSSGSLSHTVEIYATEQLKLHVYAYRNGETVNREISGNMPAGGQRTLRIRLGEDGVLVVRLE